MISNFITVSVPQWGIFAGLTVMIYGWVEKKKAFGLVGTGVLVLLGLFAAYVLAAGLLVPEDFFTAGSAAEDEAPLSPDEIPIEGRLLPVYWGLIVCGGLALAAFITELLNRRGTNVLKTITGLLALALFFFILGALRA